MELSSGSSSSDTTDRMVAKVEQRSKRLADSSSSISTMSQDLETDVKRIGKSIDKLCVAV